MTVLVKDEEKNIKIDENETSNVSIDENEECQEKYLKLNVEISEYRNKCYPNDEINHILSRSFKLLLKAFLFNSFSNATIKIINKIKKNDK